MATYFSSSLRQYAVDAEKRRALILAQADTLGGHPDFVPAGFLPEYHPALRFAAWDFELKRRYCNIAEWEGWEALPDFDLEAVRREVQRWLAQTGH